MLRGLPVFEDASLSSGASSFASSSELVHLLIFCPQIRAPGQVAAYGVGPVPISSSKEIAPAGSCSQERGGPGLAFCSR